MPASPPFERFCDLAGGARLIPVWRETLFDVDTAVSAYAKLARPPFGFLLESVVGGEQWARYTFLGTDPRGAWRLRGGRSEWWTPGEGWAAIDAPDPLADLDARLAAAQPAPVPGLPRFWGGAVGYFGYDIIRLLERMPAGPPDDLGLPDAILVFTGTVLAVDNLLGRLRAIHPVEVEPGLDRRELRRRYDAAVESLESVDRRLASTPSPDPLELRDEPETDPPFSSSMTRHEFEAGVERIREYILAGDAFQVVLSQRLGIELAARPFDLYRALRSLNPSPYLFFLELEDLCLVGSSPEVLARVEDGRVTVRPIAGTRPRGRDPSEDRDLARDLIEDEKELAEHRMLVDLGRNDVGRVARYGTVTVPERMVVEHYSHVMHLCSQVEGEVRPGLSALDVLRACFPAGTVSGAPKIRAMEIIDEIEPVRRGPYAGAVGYIGYGGRAMDTAIAIRTVVAAGGRAFVQAGAGVVVDSEPATEYEETLNKARALLRAAAMVPAPASPEA